MKFVEIGDTIINVDKIVNITYDKANDAMRINLNGLYAVGEGIYYDKLKEIIKPVRLSKHQENSVNDFPGDNMIEE